MGNLQINIWAVLVAAFCSFLIGGVWYSPIMFAKTWMRENGLNDEALRKGNPALIFGGSFVTALVMAFNLAAFLGDEATDWVWGLTAGALAGIGWVAMAIGMIYLFERKSLKLFFINAGYQVINLMVMGLIIGLWRP